MKKIKRPEWAKKAKNRRWKVVTWDMCSSIPVSYRNGRTIDRGTILHYPVGKIVVSPNGVDKNYHHICSRGIHAYNSWHIAAKNTEINESIILVYAPRWFGGNGDSKKQRAGKVFVAKKYR